jgi:hypothetical protein
MDPFARHYAAERAKAEKAAREAADPNTPANGKARMDAAQKSREAKATPDRPHPYPKFIQKPTR